MLLNPVIFLSSLLFFSSAFAQAEIPFNTPQNSIEYRASGNSYTWQPVTGTTPKPAQPYRPDFSKGDVSTAQPKATWRPELPYQHKGGAAAKMNFSAMASKTAVASAAAKEFAKGAIACGAKPGHPLAVSAAIAGCMGGGLLLGAAIDWGWHQISADDSGALSIGTEPGGYSYSTGNEYLTLVPKSLYPTGVYYSIADYCDAAASLWKSEGRNGVLKSIVGTRCNIDSGGINADTRSSVNCPAGYKYSGTSCVAPSEVPLNEEPLSQAVENKINNSPWGIGAAQAMAGVMMAGHNVFTDGTSGTITGPNIVPLGTSSESWPVNVLPGTTTVAPPGHTGATESGTQTITTNKTANNSYSGNQQTTTTGTNSTTTVTNNINNITNITNQTTSEKDEAPEENATDTPLSAIPDLYKQKYPDGLTGVFNDFKSRINTTSFVQLISALTPNISGAGTCPSWTIDLTWTPGGSMGRHTIGPDICWIWPILKIIVMVTTLFTVRRLIFGG